MKFKLCWGLLVILLFFFVWVVKLIGVEFVVLFGDVIEIKLKFDSVFFFFIGYIIDLLA